MADIKAYISNAKRLLIADGTHFSAQKPDPERRLASLDIFRGLTVALMILVDDAGGEWPKMGHAPWHGSHLGDFVMPFFLFIVGMAIPLTFKGITSRDHAVKKIIVRTLKLLLWGIMLQGGFSHGPDKLSYGVDLKKIRWCGILQRIAFAYLVMALMEIFKKKDDAKDLPPGRLSIFRLYGSHWLVGACILVVYLAVIYGMYVPHWQFTVNDEESADYGKEFSVECAVRGKLDPACNAIGYIDRKILGINHLYQHPAWKRSEACTDDSLYEAPFKTSAPAWCKAPFEPDGILSSISSVLSTITGVHFGHVHVHLKGDTARLKQWTVMGLALLILGLVLHFSHAMPLNKQLYTFSYVCVTSGAAALVFSAIYILVDMRGRKSMFLPFQWIGMNAMLVYVMAAQGIFDGFINGWYYNDPQNTLINWIQKHIFIGVCNSQSVGILLYVIFAEIPFWGIVAGIFHRLEIYWKL